MEKAADGPLEMVDPGSGVVVEVKGDWALRCIKIMDTLLHSEDIKENCKGLDLLLRTHKGLVQGEMKKFLGISNPPAAIETTAKPVPAVLSETQQARMDRKKTK